MAVQAQYPLGRVVEDAREMDVDQSAAPHLFHANISSSSANKMMKRVRDVDHHNSTPMIPTRSGISHFLRHQHSDPEVDALIGLHSEKLRAGVAEAGRRHCRELLSAMARRIGDKEAELQTATRKNADLESKMKEVAAQTQIWLDHASNTETAALGLRAALDRVLRRHLSGDAESCCERPTRSRNAGCRVCRERDVNVLLLPCRHLCLCKECEPEVDACPVCNARKNGALQVLMG